MSSEESNKTSNLIASQGLPSESLDQFVERLYSDMVDEYNGPDENFFDIWDKDYAKRQLQRKLELENET
jgi:hypothetical protein